MAANKAVTVLTYLHGVKEAYIALPEIQVTPLSHPLPPFLYTSTDRRIQSPYIGMIQVTP